MKQLKLFVNSLTSHVEEENHNWAAKGFIDVYKNIYPISTDTKIVSKVLELHIFPRLLDFSEKNGYKIVLADHQNYYPDLTFVSQNDESIKYAVDLKTTYRLRDYPDFCNGFTLGSHGKYFIARDSCKNIQFPYSNYKNHYCNVSIHTCGGYKYVLSTNNKSKEVLIIGK